MSAFGDRLRAHVAATHGIVSPEPLPAPIVDPEPVQRVTRPRIAITQPTDAAESMTLRVMVERESKSCVVCGTMFKPGCRQQVCCSTECSYTHKLELKRSKRVASIRMTEAKCVICGNPFSYDAARVGQHTRMYCSIPCRREAWKQKRRAQTTLPVESRCAWCGGTFKPVRWDNVFCSEECRTQASYDRRKGTRSRKHATTCPACGHTWSRER